MDARIALALVLLTTLLVLARTNDPLAPATRVPSDLSVIVAEVLADPDLAAGTAAGDRSRATIERQLEPDLPVEVDPGEIERIVRNLVDNAIRYGGDEPRVLVRTWLLDSEVAVEVRDDGPGIAAVDLDHVFDPFFRTLGHERGQDVVVGAVQSKAPPEAEGLLQKLEVMPLKTSDQGTAIDVEGLIRRGPAVGDAAGPAWPLPCAIPGALSSACSYGTPLRISSSIPSRTTASGRLLSGNNLRADNARQPLAIR